jgi:hypothetical protein
MYKGAHVKYPLFLSYFSENWTFSKFFSNNTQISNLTKIRPVGAELFHAERQDEANGRFLQICERA